MAAGILSIAARSQSEPQLSIALLILSLLAFSVSLALNVRATAAGLAQDKSAPVIVLFTWVAACGVLGQQLEAWPFALLAAVGFAAAVLALAREVRSPGSITVRNVAASWLLAVVALQSLSIVCSRLRIGPFPEFGLGLWFAGAATYGFVIVLILGRLIRRDVGVEDLTPDYWIAMGALAMSTVAATQVPPLVRFEPALWVAAAAWIPYLLVVEALALKRRGFEVRYDPLRWSTVFPLGMFSVATHDLGVPALAPIAAVFFVAGLAVAAWMLFAGAWRLRAVNGDVS